MQSFLGQKLIFQKVSQLLSLLWHWHAGWQYLINFFDVRFSIHTKGFCLYRLLGMMNLEAMAKKKVSYQLTKFPLVSDWFLIRALMSSKSRFNSSRSDLRSFKSDSLSFACSCLVSSNSCFSLAATVLGIMMSGLCCKGPANWLSFWIRVNFVSSVLSKTSFWRLKTALQL